MDFFALLVLLYTCTLYFYICDLTNLVSAELLLYVGSFGTGEFQPLFNWLSLSEDLRG